MSERKRPVIAVCGKGGAGKTTVAAMLTKGFAQDAHSKTLVVDADPTSGLALALGVSPHKTLNDIRMEILGQSQNRTLSKQELAQAVDYHLWDAIYEHHNIAFLSIGRPDEKGCYCTINSLLKNSIANLAAQFNRTLIDAEAGVEQINRDVVSAINILLLVSDTSTKGLRVAETIHQVSEQRGHFASTFLLINKARNEAEVHAIQNKTRLSLSGWIPEDDTIRIFDSEARSFFNLPDCPAEQAMARCLPQLTGTMLAES